MFLQSTHDERLDDLAERLQHAQAVTPALMYEFVAEACARLAALKAAGKATKVERVIEDGAWIEAALALVETELPRWKVRRMVYEDGKWLCSLSQRPNVPLEYDELAEGRHEKLSLAILGAMLEARRCTALPHPIHSRSVPQLRPMAGHAICCDNFA